MEMPGHCGVQILKHEGAIIIYSNRESENPGEKNFFCNDSLWLDVKTLAILENHLLFEKRF